MDEKSREETTGVPHLIVEPGEEAESICTHERLPPIEEVLDGMGLGTRGPPIPPPATFSVVAYPAHRDPPPGSEFSHYVFVTSDPGDPNLVADEPKGQMPEEQMNDGEKSPDTAAAKNPANSKLKTPKTGTSRNDSRDGTRRTSGDKKRAESKSKRDQQSPNRNSSSLSGNQESTALIQEGAASMDGLVGEVKPSLRLNRHRWIIPQFGELLLRLRFTSEEVGQFDQTLNFEVAGTRRRYQLHCRGVCTFPRITSEPRVVFPGRKKARESANEIVHKKWLLSEEIFEFGPLLVGNNRERVREGKFPEFTESLTIQNGSPLDAEVSFCFLDEAQAAAGAADSCFYLEPAEMSLRPMEVKTLKIYATPKEPRAYTDTLVCCVKENPEPVLFRVACSGQKPELVLDKKEFNFKQVLLHRKDSKEIKMSNNTLLPVQWRIEGADTLGDEFVCNQTSGVVEPFGSFMLVLHFR